MAQRVRLTSGSDDWTADVSGDRVALRPEGVSFTVTAIAEGDRLRVTDEHGEAGSGAAAAAGDTVWVTIDGDVFAFTVAHGPARGTSATRDHDAFTPPMSATVVRIAVNVGDAVKDGDVVIALEAMKMELPIRAPRDGIVRAIHCRAGDLVQPGQVLLDLE
jgi:3-methylcrotonyl-CoA carboxylase alpha subunit